ncbi:hypothetical protein JBL43_17640 [Aureibaculum sp. A20]|uniref:DUF4369 domain-containing protein n=1 Tax=Aureibaculum flavum TaxID=2795986 RepID=A0ABS0WVS2_9FLAO|nr:hypothetical protein [Aureibaculum flavum]MBJ2176079.1 hypothetical protein [Aureibaculum flavum]
MIKFAYFFMILMGVSSYGQFQSASIVSDRFVDYSHLVFGVDLRDKDLVGSIYINDKFSPAKLSNNNTIYNANFDAYKGEIVIESDGKFFAVAKTFDNEITFINQKKVYKVYNYNIEEKESLGFFTVLYKGDKISLLNKEIIKYFEEFEAKTGYEEYRPPTLKRMKDKLFIGYFDHSAIEVPNKKKDIFKLFSSKVKIMKSYAKDKKLNPKKEGDLLKLVIYYNSL